MSQVLTVEEAKRLIDRVGPSFGYDNTYPPDFPAGRQDLAVVRRVVRRLAENGSTYGSDTIYVVWKTSGQIRYRELLNSAGDKDYINVDEVRVKGGDLLVKVRSGGSYSGRPWKRTLRVSLADLGL